MTISTYINLHYDGNIILQMKQKWPKMTQSGPKWIQVTQHGPKMPKVAQNGPKWPRPLESTWMAQSDPKFWSPIIALKILRIHFLDTLYIFIKRAG